MRATDRLDRLHELRELAVVIDPEHHQRLVQRGCRPAHRILGQRHVAEHRPDRPVERCVGLRQQPDRSPLVDAKVTHNRSDRRNHLDRGRAGADDRDALAGQIVVVVPARGVHGRALELRQPLDLRSLGDRQPPRHGDHEPCGQRSATGKLRAPEMPRLVESELGHARIQPDPTSDLVLVDAVVGVLLQLGTGGEGA